MVPVGGGLFVLPRLFGGLFFDRLVAFFPAFFAAFFLAIGFSLLGYDVGRLDYQRILNRSQYQSSSRTRRVRSSRRRCAMSLSASRARASPKPG